MRTSRAVPIPYLNLDEDSLAELAAHFSELADTRRSGLFKELANASMETRPDPEIHERVEARRNLWAPKFSINTSHGPSLTGDDWQEMWREAHYPTVVVIAMEATSEKGTRVELRLPLLGDDRGRTNVYLSAENNIEMERELGFFAKYFERHRAPNRERLRLASIFGSAVWFGIPSFALVLLWFARVRPAIADQNAGLALLVTAMAFIGYWAVALYLSNRLSPRVLVKDVGPMASLRPHAGELALGLLVTFIGAGILALLPQ